MLVKPRPVMKLNVFLTVNWRTVLLRTTDVCAGVCMCENVWVRACLHINVCDECGVFLQGLFSVHPLDCSGWDAI